MTNISSRSLLGAVALLALIGSQAHAACEPSDRISLDDAECLEGGWSNQPWPFKDHARVRNWCDALGTVVAKIDRKDAADWTVWLDDWFTVHKSGTAGDIRGIHCCSDLSDLCNRADIIHPEGCLEQFHTSEAYTGTAEGEASADHERRCHGAYGGATATANPDKESCSFDTFCGWWVGGEFTGARRQVTARYLDVPDLILSRDGQLRVP